MRYSPIRKPPVTETTRVLLDATAIPRDLGGVGRYLEYLIPALAALDGVDLVIAVQAHDADRIGSSSPSARVSVVPAWAGRRGGRLIWEQTGLSRLAQAVGADVIHSPHYTMPLATRLPVVVTLHDATFFSHPELHGRVKRLFFRAWSRRSARRAAQVVVPSQATADELVHHAALSPGRAVVAYHGVDRDAFHVPTEAERTAVASALGLPTTGWIAFLGTVEPRKNVANLVRAYRALASAGSLPPLVIAGGQGWDTETRPLIDGLPPGADVRMLGYVDAALLPALLGGSTVFAYPSLGEGFGLPILEAMACGAPTLTTRMLALPEVGGDAVEYSEPDAESLTRALGDLLADAPRRAELSAAGPARAALFTWDRSARAHLDAYRSAANS